MTCGPMIAEPIVMVGTEGRALRLPRGVAAWLRELDAVGEPKLKQRRLVRLRRPAKGAPRVDVAWLRHAPAEGVAAWLQRALGEERSAELARRLAQAT